MNCPQVLVGFLAALTAIGAHAADYRAEATQLAREIIDTHPRGREIGETPEFRAAQTALLERARNTDLAHYAIALGRLFHTVNDGHTAVLGMYAKDPVFAWSFPLRLQRFNDGIYVVAAKDEATKLKGGRILRIGSRPVAEIIRAYVPTGPSGNRAWPANWVPFVLSRAGWLLGLDVMRDAASPVEFSVALADGREVAAMLVATANGSESLEAVERKTGVLEGSPDGTTNHVVKLQDGRALALVIGAMEDSEKKSFDAFTAEAEAALRDPAIERVIIDLRQNGGGDNMLAEPLRRILNKSRFNRSGGLYALTSPQTFSAAMNFATRLERETDVLFIGEPTGGSPNHFGDAKFANGIESGLPYIISTVRWQDSSPFDNRPWILPDVPVSPTYADYISGRDAALEAALSHQARHSGQGDARKRLSKPWERESQVQPWRFFYE